MKENGLIKKLVSDYLEENKSDGLISSYEVEMVEESPEMKIIREVMEEPLDTIGYNVKIQLTKPINYIKIDFIINDT